MFRLVTLALLIPMLFSFRSLSSLKWNINTNDPTLWVKLDLSALQAGFSSTEFENGDDFVSGIPTESQVEEMLRIIFDDYNSTMTSYVRLAFHPVDGYDFGSEDSLDTAFSTQTALTRTITVSTGSVGIASGYAQLEDDGNHILGCKISLSPKTLKDAESFKSTLTHEIGHCLGLDHVHEDFDSIMGYNSSRHDLGVDDRMGITSFYPSDPSYSETKNNFGLQCSRQ